MKPPSDHPEILSVHPGHSANCSSVGSVVDFLFLSSAAGAALLSAVALTLRRTPQNDDEKQDDDA